MTDATSSQRLQPPLDRDDAPPELLVEAQLRAPSRHDRADDDPFPGSSSDNQITRPTNDGFGTSRPTYVGVILD